jgi:hypothetical protein
MKIEKDSLQEFESEDNKRNLKFVLITGLSILAILVSLFLYFYQFRTVGFKYLVLNTPKSIIITQLVLLSISILFAIRKKIGWALMAIISSVFIVVILKNILKLILSSDDKNLFESFILTRGAYFLLNYSIIIILLFNKSLLKYMSVNKTIIYVTLIVLTLVSTIIVIA